MDIKTENNNGAVVVKPVGRINSANAGEFEAALNEAIAGEVSSVTVDMSEVDFISSMGLRILVAAYKNLRGKEFVLAGPNEATTEILRMSGLLKIFTVK